MRVVSYPYAVGPGPATGHSRDQVQFLHAQTTPPCIADMSGSNDTGIPSGSCRLVLHALNSTALHVLGAPCMRCGRHYSVNGTGNGLIQLVDYARDEFEWRHHGSAGGILTLAIQPEAQ